MAFPTSETRTDRDDRTGVLLTVGSDRTLTVSLIAELNGLCDRVEDSGGGGPVVIGVGGRSPNGSPAWPGTPEIHLVGKWEGALRRLERLSAAVVAVAQGHCTGPAAEVLLACDYRIGTPDLALEVAGGAASPWPGMALHRLANQVGVARARSLVLFGGVVPAAQAVEIGVLDEVAEDVDAAVAVAHRAARVTSGSELAMRRRLLLDATSTSFEDALGAHLAACDRTLRRDQAAG